jgi:transposase
MFSLAHAQLLGDLETFSRTLGGFTMKLLVTDALWQRLQPLLPSPPRRRFRFPGRKRLDYRKILTGILFVLMTDIAWDGLSAELGCGCGKTCRHCHDRCARPTVKRLSSRFLSAATVEAGEAFRKLPAASSSGVAAKHTSGKSGMRVREVRLGTAMGAHVA